MDEINVFDALGDPNRRAILDGLYKKSGQSVSELARHCSISRQAADKHIQILHRAGLVVMRVRGRRRCHYLNPLNFRRAAARWLKKFENVKMMDLPPE